MATLGSLNIGDYVYDPLTYSSRSKQGDSQGQKRSNECIVWQIIGKNHDGNNTVTLYPYNSVDSMYFDYEESSNPDTDRKSKGNSRYLYSNILQWLNSDSASNWWTKKHTYDEVNSYQNRYPGFLYRTSSKFKSALQTVSKTVAKPNIDGGGYETVTAKVHLLSLKEAIGTSSSDVEDEGTRYEYFENNSVTANQTRSAWYNSSNNYTSGDQFVSYAYKSKTSSPSITHDKASSSWNCSPIVVLPASTIVSSNKYKRYAKYPGNGEYYAMLSMPLIVELSSSGAGSAKNPTVTIRYTVYDDSASISTLKIFLDGTTEVYSTVNLEKGRTYTYSVNTSSWAIEESHRYSFTVTNSSGTTVTESIEVYKQDSLPDVFIYDESDGTYKYEFAIGSRDNGITKPPTIKIKVDDADNLQQPIYLYLSKDRYLDDEILDTIGTYTGLTEINYTIPDNIWKQLADEEYYGKDYYFIASNVEYTGQTIYSRNYAHIKLYKKTPEPYVTVDDTDVGSHNIGFSVDYTPDTDSIEDLTNVSIYLDTTDTLLQSIDNPVTGSQLTYIVSKSDLYNMPIGSHKLIFVVTDDLNKTGSTEVLFTRYNNAPNIIIESTLGNKNLGFTVSFAVEDNENDTINEVKAYIDSMTGTPFETWSSVDSGDTLDFEITKEELYNLSLGNHKIYIMATDDYGTTAADSSFTRTNNAPSVTVSQETTVHYEDFDVTYLVSDTESDTVDLEFKIGNQTLAVVSDVTLDTSLTQEIDISGLSFGQKTLTIIATDSQSQSSVTTMDFTISTVPVITVEEIGNKADAFNVEFKVDDEDGDALSVRVYLDNDTLIYEASNVPHDTMLYAPVSAARFNALEYGEHTVLIVLTDVNGREVSDEETFAKCSIPTMRITTPIPHEFIDEFTITVEYDNADSSEVDVKAYIDDVEVPQ